MPDHHRHVQLHLHLHQRNAGIYQLHFLTSAQGRNWLSCYLWDMYAPAEAVVRLQAFARGYIVGQKSIAVHKVGTRKGNLERRRFESAKMLRKVQER